MSTYSSVEFESMFAIPIRALEYRDMGTHPALNGAVNGSSEARGVQEGGERVAQVQLSEVEFSERIKRERAEAAEQTELRLRQDYEAKLQAARATVATAISGFETQRTDYFGRVESEVVQLALAIAAKILHRESQVDPMLVATLVRMAIDKMREGSKVTIRVGTRRFAQWRAYFAGQPNAARVEVVEDASLTEHDCVLETELGSANFGLDTQLKEVEQGFFDLLALKPLNK
ncbi:MAG: FliH/SctL family protein [Terracidiphilus sp.]